MERLLVTGVDGPLGVQLALKLTEHMEVLGLCCEQMVESPLFRTAEWQPRDRQHFGELVHQWQPQWILHCGPLSTSSWDPPRADAAAEREPAVVAHLAQLAEELDARLTVISSDALFTGPRMFHDESSVAASPSPRAAHLRRMEQALAQTRTLVVRTHAYGWSPVDSLACFAERAHEALSAGAPIAADGLHHATPILAADLAEPLLRAYELRVQGVYHLSGAERTSAYHFVAELAAAFGLHPPRTACLPRGTNHESWPDETSLNSKRARRRLEMATPMLREGLERFAEQQNNGWRDQYRGVGPIQHAVAA